MKKECLQTFRMFTSKKARYENARYKVRNGGKKHAREILQLQKKESQ